MIDSGWSFSYSYAESKDGLIDFLKTKGLLKNINSYSKNFLKKDLKCTNQEILDIITYIENFYNIEISDSKLLDKILFEDLDPTFDSVFNLAVTEAYRKYLF